MHRVRVEMPAPKGLCIRFVTQKPAKVSNIVRIVWGKLHIKEVAAGDCSYRGINMELESGTCHFAT